MRIKQYRYYLYNFIEIIVRGEIATSSLKRVYKYSDFQQFVCILNKNINIFMYLGNRFLNIFFLSKMHRKNYNNNYCKNIWVSFRHIIVYSNTRFVF